MHRPDPRGRALLRDYRRATTTPRAQRDVVWDRIEASLDAGALGPALDPGPEPRPVRPRGWVGPVVGMTVALAAVVVAALALRPAARREAVVPRTPSQAVHEAAPHEPAPVMPASRVASPPAAEAASASPPSARAPAIEPPSARHRRASSSSDRDPSSAAPAPEAPALDDALAAELALIREARVALRGDRPDGALELLDAHARAFPAGQMREDRQVLRIEALCAAGKAPQARAEATQFLRAFASSAHADRVRTTCAAP